VQTTRKYLLADVRTWNEAGHVRKKKCNFATFCSDVCFKRLINGIVKGVTPLVQLHEGGSDDAVVMFE